MENGKSILENKWVWLGGAAVVAFVLFGGLGGGASSAGTADLAAVTSLNQIGADLASKQVDSATQLGLARYQYDASVASGFFSTVNNMNNNATVLQRTYAEANAGIENSIITSGAATVQDILNNAAKTEQTQISMDGAYKIAQANANAAVAAAKAQSSGNIFSSIAKAVTSLGTAAIAAL